MKNIVKPLVCLIFVTIIKSSYGQQKQAVFEDGTVIKYEMLHNDVEKMNRFTMWIGGKSYGEGLSMIGAQYYKPGSFFVQADYGIGHIGLDGLYVLNNTTVDKSINLTLKNSYLGSNTVLRQQVKENLKKQIDYGIHGGYAINNITNSGWGVTPDIIGIQSHQVAIGIGRVASRYVSWLPEGSKKPLRGTGVFGVYADLLLYPVRTETNKFSTVGSDNKPLSAKDVSSLIGARLYMEGRNSAVGYGDWGIMYRLGAGYGLGKKVYAMFGFGIYWGIKGI